MPLWLTAPDSGETTPDTEPDEPAALRGERIHFVQERHNRRLEDDRFEPWVTLTLPRTVPAGERFILELAYEGKLVQRLRGTGDFLLKDTLYWRPRHPDTRTSRLDLTFRVPERYRVASAGTLREERVGRQDPDHAVGHTLTGAQHGVPLRAVRRNRGRSHCTARRVGLRRPQPPGLRAGQPREDGRRPDRFDPPLHRLLRTVSVRVAACHRRPHAERTGVSWSPAAVVSDIRRHARWRSRAVPGARGGAPMVGRGGRLGALPRSVDDRRLCPVRRGTLHASWAREAG